MNEIKVMAASTNSGSGNSHIIGLKNAFSPKEPLDPHTDLPDHQMNSVREFMPSS